MDGVSNRILPTILKYFVLVLLVEDCRNLFDVEGIGAVGIKQDFEALGIVPNRPAVKFSLQDVSVGINVSVNDVAASVNLEHVGMFGAGGSINQLDYFELGD